MNLKQRMANNGFESNDSYEFVLNALNNQPNKYIACLNIEGNSGRRKTAFANALAHAQDNVTHILYFDCSSEPNKPSTQEVITLDEDGKPPIAPIKPLDKTLSDACAFSEAERTILIIDQLQDAPFDEHIRLYEFLMSSEWHYGGSTFYANPRHLQLFLISEQTMYHSLQTLSFRVWVEKVSNTIIPYTPDELGFHSDIAPVMNALNQLFALLGVAPTFSEYQKILNDVPISVRTGDDLCKTLYGWMEGIERKQLKEPPIQDMIMQTVMPSIEHYLGVDDIIAVDSPLH